MTTAKRDQKGFAVIAAILIAAILLAIGGVVWYVMRANHQTTAQLNAATQESVTTTANKPPAAATKNTLFVFKEFGLQMNLPSSLSGLSYYAKVVGTGSDQATVLYLTIPSFTSADESCYGQTVSGDAPSFSALSKFSGQYDSSQPIQEQFLKQFASFYVGLGFPNGLSDCTASGVSPQLLQTDAQNLNNEFKDAFLNSATLVK